MFTILIPCISMNSFIEMQPNWQLSTETSWTYLFSCRLIACRLQVSCRLIAYRRPSSIVQSLHVGLGRLLSFSSAQEPWSMAVVQTTLYAIIASQGEKPAWWLAPAKAYWSRKKFIAPLLTLLQGEFKWQAERAGGTKSNRLIHISVAKSADFLAKYKKYNK